MPNVPTSTPEQFYQGAPLLLVPDVPTTAAFYRRILGFKTDPGTATPEYTVVWRGNAAGLLGQGGGGPAGGRVFFFGEGGKPLPVGRVQPEGALSGPHLD